MVEISATRRSDDKSNRKLLLPLTIPNTSYREQHKISGCQKIKEKQCSVSTMVLNVKKTAISQQHVCRGKRKVKTKRRLPYGNEHEHRCMMTVHRLFKLSEHKLAKSVQVRETDVSKCV